MTGIDTARHVPEWARSARHYGARCVTGWYSITCSRPTPTPVSTCHSASSRLTQTTVKQAAACVAGSPDDMAARGDDCAILSRRDQSPRNIAAQHQVRRKPLAAARNTLCPEIVKPLGNTDEQIEMAR